MSPTRKITLCVSIGVITRRRGPEVKLNFCDLNTKSKGLKIRYVPQ